MKILLRFWEADSLSYEASVEIGRLLNDYGKKLEVICDNNLKLDKTYTSYIFWNGTVYSH